MCVTPQYVFNNVKLVTTYTEEPFPASTVMQQTNLPPPRIRRKAEFEQTRKKLFQSIWELPNRVGLESRDLEKSEVH